MHRSATPLPLSDDEEGPQTIIWGTSIDTNGYTKKLRRFLKYYEDVDVDTPATGRGKYVQLLEQVRPVCGRGVQFHANQPESVSSNHAGRLARKREMSSVKTTPS